MAEYFKDAPDITSLPLNDVIVPMRIASEYLTAQLSAKPAFPQIGRSIRLQDLDYLYQTANLTQAFQKTVLLGSQGDSASKRMPAVVQAGFYMDLVNLVKSQIGNSRPGILYCAAEKSTKDLEAIWPAHLPVKPNAHLALTKIFTDAVFSLWMPQFGRRDHDPYLHFEEVRDFFETYLNYGKKINLKMNELIFKKYAETLTGLIRSEKLVSPFMPDTELQELIKSGQSVLEPAIYSHIYPLSLKNLRNMKDISGSN